MHETDKIEPVMRYHKRTKHGFDRYAPGPGELDWANQPNPFRRYEGAPLVRLPRLGAREAPLSPRYDDLFACSRPAMRGGSRRRSVALRTLPATAHLRSR